MNKNEDIHLFEYCFSFKAASQQIAPPEYQISKVNVINKLTQLPIQELKENHDKSTSSLKKKLTLFTLDLIPQRNALVFPEIDILRIFDTPKPVVNPIKEKQIEERKELQVKHTEIINPNQNPLPGETAKKYQAALFAGAENFSAIIPKIKALAFDSKYKKEVDNIIWTIKLIIYQINGQTEIDSAIQSLTKALNEVFAAKKKDLYIITIEQIVSLSINKAQNYLDNANDYYLYLTKVINDLHSSTLINFFMQRIAYSCPYIIPRQYTKKDFPNKETLLHRLGFLEEGEPILDFNYRMENFEYLYFALISNNLNKYTELINEYLQILSEIKVRFAIANGYKVFLNVLGIKLKSQLWDKIQPLSAKIINDLIEEISKTTKNDIRDININNCLHIKKFTERIANNLPMVRSTKEASSNVNSYYNY